MIVVAGKETAIEPGRAPRGKRLAGLLVLLAGCGVPQDATPGDREPASGAPLLLPQSFSELPVSRIEVDLGADQGALELWRHSVGHGGINSLPLPERVVTGTAKLRPRWVRIFIQEFFSIYPDHGRFDWSRLDPYMDAFARTGAKVVAAITIKPRPLYPKIDANIWRPGDVAEWQRVISALVRRYSVEKPIVAYWEIGNEPDIGEDGGCPYRIADPADYAQYYKMTVEPILAAFPGAKVGGPAVADAGGDYLPRFIAMCRKDRLRLDFVSWHLYSDNPDDHARLVAKYRKLLEGLEPRPEMLVTEWNKGFDAVSVEEMAFDPRRAAIVASCILAMEEARADGSFYYHLWDQTCFVDEFKPFFANPQIMHRHWNEIPHRFGLFGVGQEVRPQYFVYQMLARMGDRRVRSASETRDLRVLAGRDGTRAAVLIVNHAAEGSRDRIAALQFAGLAPGRKRLVVTRVDRSRAWSGKALELTPVERREVDVSGRFECQLYCPGDSVSLVEVR